MITVDELLNVVETSDRPRTKTSSYSSMYKKRNLNEWMSNTSTLQVYILFFIKVFYIRKNNKKLNY